MRQIIIDSLVQGSILGVSVYIIKHVIVLLYYVIRYGGNYVKYYLKANIRRFELCGYIVRRNSYIKIKLKDKEYEGFVIGLMPDEKMVIRTLNGDVIAYNVNYIDDEDILMLRRRGFNPIG